MNSRIREHIRMRLHRITSQSHQFLGVKNEGAKECAQNSVSQSQLMGSYAKAFFYDEYVRVGPKRKNKSPIRELTIANRYSD